MKDLKRRGFLGSLAALVTLPFLPKPRLEDYVITPSSRYLDDLSATSLKYEAKVVNDMLDNGWLR